MNSGWATRRCRAPSFTFADQEPVAEEVPELADDRSILDVMPRVSGEDLMRSFGVEHGVEGETDPWRADSEAGDVAVGRHGSGVGAQLVALQATGAAQQQRAVHRRGAPRASSRRADELEPEAVVLSEDDRDAVG